MVDKTKIQTRFSLPSNFTDAMRVSASKKIIALIQERTAEGISATGSSFPKYSKDYKESMDFKNGGKSSSVNLELTGDMMASMELLEHNTGYVVIGYPTDHPDAGKVEGNVIGSYGSDSPNASRARNFLGLPQSQINIIIAEVKNESSESYSIDEASSVLAQNILSRMFM